ncbi:hypothetical protein [Teredinibacter turnerae]|uniref:hypothetical protein n=1 Tax=Teredinibacter turnerae TaxID=2426 RepID=UPI0030D18A7F
MADIKILKTSLHRIDLNEEEIGDRLVIKDDNDFDQYVENIVDDMYQSSSYKSYRFSSGETEVAKQAANMSVDCWDDRSQIIAKRLLRIEKLAQERVKKMVSLRTGSLVQIYAEVDGQITLIITKVDHNSYLNEVDLKKQLGLPENQRVQKTAIISFEADNSVNDIRINDTNRKISQYWWQDFLETEEIHSSEKNTLTAFNAIDRELHKTVRKKSKSDFWTLRNAVISYFRTNDSCTFENLIETVFDGYQPDSPELKIDDLISKVKELPNKHKFDSQFEISTSSIKARINNQIKLAENLELKFTGEVQNLSSLIDTGELDDGRKYLRIFSDAGYDEFHRFSEADQ